MIEEKFRRAMERFCLPPQCRVTVALSGGMDSVTLLWLLKELPGRRFELEAVHVNHGLRGEAARRDQAFCAALCRDWGIPFRAYEGNAALLAEERGLSPEEGARALRYGFLDPLADGRQGFVATAHHREDQLETFFINLYRGSGSRGLSGIDPRRGGYLRPMLEIQKAEIAAFAAEKGLPYVTDETNADSAYQRNFLRHEVLPLLESRAEAHFSAGLAVSMQNLREEDEALTLWAESVQDTRAEALAALPNAVLKRVLDRMAGKPLERPRFYEIAALIRAHPPAGQIQLSGGRYFRLEYGRCVFTAPAEEAFVAVEPDVPAYWGNYRFLVRSEEINSPFTHFQIDCDKISGSLTFRRKKAGDRFVPAGRGGTSRLQKRLKNDRVPRTARDLLWVLADGADRIVWAERYGAAEGYAPDETTKRKFSVEIGNTKGDL